MFYDKKLVFYSIFVTNKMYFFVSGMVRFDTNPESYNSVKMLRNLESKVENLISLDNHITSMEEEIMINQKYIKSMGNAGSSLHGRAVPVELEDDASLSQALSTSSRGSRSGSLGPSSSSGMNSNNINFTGN